MKVFQVRKIFKNWVDLELKNLMDKKGPDQRTGQEL